MKRPISQVRDNLFFSLSVELHFDEKFVLNNIRILLPPFRLELFLNGRAHLLLIVFLGVQLN